MINARSLCLPLVFVAFTCTSATAQALSDRLVVRFEDGEVTAPAGVRGATLDQLSFRRQALRNTLAQVGVERISRLFPHFRSEDRFTTNLIGERVQLEDLSSFYLLTLRPGAAAYARLRLLGTRGVRSAAPPTLRMPMSVTPNDPLFSKQWGLYNTGQSLCSPYDAPTLVSGNDIGAREAWAITTGSSSVRVGILDSGIRATHQDFGGRVNLYNGISFTPIATGSPALCGTPYDCDDEFTDLPIDDFGHGTGVTGVVAASGNNSKGVAGVAWGVTPISIKVMDCAGQGFSCTSARGFDWAREQGIPILNMSYGFSVPDDAERAAARNCLYAGQLLCAAMGNNNGNVAQYPAAYGKSICAVGAYYGNGTRWDQGANRGSNYGSWIDISAPGGQLIASTADGTNSSYYALVSCGNDFGGTSAATPVVAGVAALLLSKYPSLLGEDLLEIMKRTAVDVSPSGADDSSGAGHVRADLALQYAAAPKEIFHLQAQNLSVYSTGNTETRTFNNVPGLDDGSYSCKVITLRKAVTFAGAFSSVPDVWVRASGTMGAADASPYDYNDELRWGQVVSGTLTTTGCTLETNIYEIYPSGGGTFYWPDSAAAATVAMTAIGPAPPSPITNLTVDWTSTSQAALYWTATGEDGVVGTAASYDMRRSTSAITEANFSSATSVTGMPAPAAAGTNQSKTISGLSACTGYYFAIKAIDHAGNAGAISNVESASTLCTGGGGAPQRIEVPAVAELVLLNASAARQEALFRVGVPQSGGGSAELAIFDVGGRRVRGWDGRTLSPGWHDLSWDTRTDSGKLAGSGVYFLRLRVGGVVLSRRLVVVR